MHFRSNSSRSWALIDGFLALATFLPQDRVGVVVLSNLGEGQFYNVATYNILDRLLGLDQVPWNRRLLESRAKQEASASEAVKQGATQQRAGTTLSHPLGDYAGEYEHAGYGVLQIARAGDALTLTYNGMTSPLRHFHYDYFEVPENPLDPLEKRKISFATALNGDIGSVAVPFEPAVKDIVFIRRADARMRERAFLAPLAGQYELGPQTLTIVLKGDDTLVVVAPGQADRDLVPARGTTFDIKGLPGYSIEFRTDAAGTVTGITFFQPGGTFAGRRK
jgi:hypothetical protein